MYKRATITILVLVLSTWFWAAIKPWIANPLIIYDYHVWLWPLVAIIILVAIEGFALLAVGQRSWRWSMVAVSLVPYFVLFGIRGYYWTLLPLMFLLQIHAGHGIHLEVEERLKIHIRQIMDRGLPSLVTSILIMISVAFYLNPATQAAAQQQQLPDSVKTFIAKTVDSFVSGQVQDLPQQEQQSTISQITNEVFAQFNNFLRPFFKYFPPILAFGLFLALQGLSFIIVWLGALLVLLIFNVLKRAGFIQLKTVQREAEELEF